MDMPAIGTYDEEIKLQDMVIRKGQLAETLIVNILSATNTELVNCKALEWSTLVDKDGKRTLNLMAEDEFQTAYPQQLAKHLVGVHSLAEKIAELQNAMIINFLPNLSHQIDQRLNSEIRDLPKEMKLGGVVHAFSKFILDLKEVLKTEYVNLIRVRLKDLSEQIKEKLKSSKNTFLEDEIAALDSGDSDSDHPPSPSHSCEYQNGHSMYGVTFIC
ncbi:unnamed protein product [Lactuca saligna]|uniref:Uncharacterized protein n=1 Tax=Lactuca saligna TaxID=75948 RepID=A0AA35ZKK7_LACSI|nr:unnamed protein product [Lactuca saligna]